MKKIFPFVTLVIISFLVSGCGYSATSLLPSYMKTVHVDHFKNNVKYSTEGSRRLYFPLMEVDIRKAIIARYLFDGNLRIAKIDQADIVLKGELVNYDRNALRYTDSDEVEEQRILVTVNLQLWDQTKDELVWEERGFTGESTYFVEGPLVKSESEAVAEAVEDLARRVVERTIENW